MPDHSFFYLGLCLLLIHEMDAVRCHEWRIFPGLSLLSEKAGYYVFMVLHIPLYLAFYWGLHTNPFGWIQGLNVFFIVHAIAHVLFLRHRNNEFNNLFSWLIIGGAAVAGMIDIGTGSRLS